MSRYQVHTFGNCMHVNQKDIQGLQRIYKLNEQATLTRLHVYKGKISDSQEYYG